MVQGYYTEEAVEWDLNYADPSIPIGVPKSLVMRGGSQEKGPLGRKL
jgi:hypothetical protein